MVQVAVRRILLLCAVAFASAWMPDARAASLSDRTFGIAGKPAMSRRHSIALRPDGRIVIGGMSFIRVGGGTVDVLAVDGLKKDGEIDPSFGDNLGEVNLGLGPAAPDERVNSTLVLRDGSILAVSHLAVVPGSPGGLPGAISRVVRVSADGSTVTRWPDVPALVSFTERPDGELYAWGNVALTGVLYGMPTPYIRRFKADGSDGGPFEFPQELKTVATGAPGGALVRINDLTLTPDGDVAVALAYARFPVARLSPTGTLRWAQAGWPSGLRENAGRVFADAEGRITAMLASDSSASPLYRFNTDGALDTSFHSPAILSPGPATRMRDGKLLIWGGFQSVAGFPRQNFVRLMADGSVDMEFDTHDFWATRMAFGMVEQPDGRVLALCDFVPPPMVNTEVFRLLTSNEDIRARRTAFYAPDSIQAPECGVRNRITITRAGDITGTNLITVATDGGRATEGVDFAPFATNIVFAPGQRFADIDLTIGSDDGNDPDESFAIRFTPTQTDFTSANPSLVYIRDAVCSIGFSTKRVEASEGDSRNPVPGIAIPLNITGNFPFRLRRVDVSAREGRDYLATLPGSDRVTLIPLDNAFADGDRTVRLELETDGPGVTVAGAASAEVTIRDDDTAAGPSRGFASTRVAAVDRIVPYLDRGWLVNGSFTAVDGTPRTGLARLTRDGLLDPSFQPPAQGFEPYCAAVQTDGKVLVGGRFDTAWSPVTRGVIRLEQDGRLDPEFFLQATNTDARILAIDQEGRILVHWVRDNLAEHTLRLNPDGSLQQRWGPETDWYFAGRLLIPEPGGSLVVGAASGYYRYAADGSARRLVHASEISSSGISEPVAASIPSSTGGIPDVWIAGETAVWIHDGNRDRLTVLLAATVEGRSYSLAGASALLPLGDNRVLICKGSLSILLDRQGQGVAVHSHGLAYPDPLTRLSRPTLAPWGEIGVRTYGPSDGRSGWLRLDTSGVPVADIAFQRIANTAGLPSVTLRGQSPSGFRIDYSDDLVSWNPLLDRADINTGQSLVLPEGGANPNPARRFYRVRVK